MSPRRLAPISSPVTIGEVRDAIADLQKAVRSALVGVPGLAGNRPVDVVAALDIDLKLAWKVTSIAQSGDPFSCVRHLPGSAGWGILAEAFSARGVASRKIAEATNAFERVQRAGEAWAGSRRAFLALSAATVRGADKRLDVLHRRQLHEGGKYVWGVHARAAIRLDAIAPSGTDRVDCATLRASLDIERLRSDAPWRVDSPTVIDDDGAIRDIPRREPLEGRTRKGDPPYLISSLCSDPPPETVEVPAGSGLRRLELAEGEIGPAGRCSIVHGTILRNVQSSMADGNDHGLFQRFWLRSPAATQVFDLFVHEDILRITEEPEVVLYADLASAGEVGVRYGPRDRIPCAIEVNRLGRGLRRVRLPEWDRHADAAKLVFSRTGWAPLDFELFRVRLTYPPVPSTLSFELPFVG